MISEMADSVHRIPITAGPLSAFSSAVEAAMVVCSHVFTVYEHRFTEPPRPGGLRSLIVKRDLFEEIKRVQCDT